MQALVRRTALGVTALAGALLLATGTAPAAPVTVNLRVEGSSATTFEAPVTTDGHTIAGHPCDGTNAAANPVPGPTMTGALDDASRTGAFTWSGTWFDSFQDFGIDRIGPDANSSTAFWGYALNFKPTQVGGCQQRVAAGDEVLFGYDFFSKAHLLRLGGPATAEAGQPITVTVTDGQDGSPMAGASVGGQLTGADGTAQVSFAATGVQRLKAERADSLRSNALVVCVHRGVDGTCGTTGAPGAGVDVRLPGSRILGIRDGQRFSARRAPRLLRGAAEPGGAGLLAVRLRVRRSVAGRCFYYSAKVERFRRSGCSVTYFFYTVSESPQWSYLLPARLAPGRYAMDALVVDRWGREAAARVRFTVLGIAR
jgi:hypothetical protein